jgi:hypothetical protein
VEEDKEIAANLSKKLGEVRRAYESNESDDDDVIVYTVFFKMKILYFIFL